MDGHRVSLREIGIGVLLTASACSGSTTIDAEPCEAGERRICELDGCPATRTCSADGRGYGPCLCDEGGSGGSPGGGAGTGEGGGGGASEVPPGGGVPSAAGVPSATGGSAGAGSGGTGGSGAGGSGGVPDSSGGAQTGGTTGGTGGVAESGGTGGVYLGEACPGMPMSSAAGAASCPGSVYQPEPTPVDMFVMLDRSISMIEHNVLVDGQEVTRWAALTQGIERFVNDPAAADTRIGLGIFSYSGSPDEAVECNTSLYAEPKIEIGPIADVGDDIVLYIQDLEANFQLGGFTPTAAALEGAIGHAKAWAAADPLRQTVVVLLTDGLPTQCITDVAEIAAIAGLGATTEPRIRTYVIGVQGAWNLQQIAQQGGTEAPFVVGQSGDAAAQLVDALTEIAEPAAYGCTISLPISEDYPADFFERLTLELQTSTLDVETIPKLGGPGDCASSEYGGWYFDDEAAASDDDPSTAPSALLTCPCTCARFAEGVPSVHVGCDPLIL